MKSVMKEMQYAIDGKTLARYNAWIEKHAIMIIIVVLSIVSVWTFVHYLNNGLGLAYNDARSHLDIGRRVVEGINAGIAQLGSVWLPLPHILMVPTIWNDFMWHSGLAGALQSMIAYVLTGIFIYKFLQELQVSLWSRMLGVAIFASNTNVLYLQSTAMTELLLLVTITAGSYYVLLWFSRNNDILYLVLAAFWIMLSTLVRYDGWFQFFFAAMLITLYMWRHRDYHVAEGHFVLFCTLGGFGIFFWLMWNLLIFGDPLYFAFGPYSAHAQQTQLDMAGVLQTKSNWFMSLKMYMYALTYNSIAYTMILGGVGFVTIMVSKSLNRSIKLASTILIAPFLFNVLALYLGHSVLYIQGISGETWFNVRYGVMMMPAIAICVGYLFYYVKRMRFVIAGTLLFVSFFVFSSGDAVTIDDARVGSSQKNVSEISGWLKEHVANEKELILISAASHDSIIFTSGLPMKRFVHEGAGKVYDEAIKDPDLWVRWIIVRSNSSDDSTWRAMQEAPGFAKYDLVDHYPFADVYQLKDEYIDELLYNAEKLKK